MFTFDEFQDPYGPFGNMQEVPREDNDAQPTEDEIIKDCVLRGALMLAGMIVGIVVVTIISVLF